MEALIFTVVVLLSFSAAAVRCALQKGGKSKEARLDAWIKKSGCAECRVLTSSWHKGCPVLSGHISNLMVGNKVQLSWKKCPDYRVKED